jgi:hypothetical protein
MTLFHMSYIMQELLLSIIMKIKLHHFICKILSQSLLERYKLTLIFIGRKLVQELKIVLDQHRDTVKQLELVLDLDLVLLII